MDSGFLPLEIPRRSCVTDISHGVQTYVPVESRPNDRIRNSIGIRIAGKSNPQSWDAGGVSLPSMQSMRCVESQAVSKRHVFQRIPALLRVYLYVDEHTVFLFVAGCRDTELWLEIRRVYGTCQVQAQRFPKLIASWGLWVSRSSQRILLWFKILRAWMLRSPIFQVKTEMLQPFVSRVLKLDVIQFW